MPFLDPRKCLRNTARYQEIDSTPEFILQQHRYSIRKHRYGARIITRNGKSYLKIAKSVNVESAKAREWRYITEEIPKVIPDTLKDATKEQRAEWIISHLMTIRQAIGDTNFDEDEDEDELEEYENSLDGYNSDSRLCEQRSRRFLYNQAMDPPLTPQAGRAESSEFPATKKTRRRLIQSLPHLRNRHSAPSKEAENEIDNSTINYSNIDSKISLDILESSKGSKALSPMGRTSSQLTKSSTILPEEGGELNDTKPINKPDATLTKHQLLLSKLGPSTMKLMAKNDEELQATLPSYLTSAAKEKKRVVTMEKLKQEHERKLMVIGVTICTLVFVLMRIVSFDAFVILVIAADIGVLYFVRHRHAFVKRFAKSSIKRRMRFTKQWMNHRIFGSNGDKESRSRRQSEENAGTSLGRKRASSAEEAYESYDEGEPEFFFDFDENYERKKHLRLRNSKQYSTRKLLSSAKQYFTS